MHVLAKRRHSRTLASSADQFTDPDGLAAPDQRSGALFGRGADGPSPAFSGPMGCGPTQRGVSAGAVSTPATSSAAKTRLTSPAGER
jgi:hypothetical protein